MTKPKEIYKLKNGTVYSLKHTDGETYVLWHRSMDGMYSYSKDIHGSTANVYLGTKVKPLEQLTYKQFVDKYGTEALRNEENGVN